MAADTQFDAPTQRSRRPEHVQAHKQHVHCRFRRACESSTHDGCSKRFLAACVRRRMSRPLNLLRLHAQTTRQSIRRRAVERGSTAARAPESRALSTQRRCWTALFWSSGKTGQNSCSMVTTRKTVSRVPIGDCYFFSRFVAILYLTNYTVTAALQCCTTRA